MLRTLCLTGFGLGTVIGQVEPVPPVHTVPEAFSHIRLSEEIISAKSKAVTFNGGGLSAFAVHATLVAWQKRTNRNFWNDVKWVSTSGSASWFLAELLYSGNFATLIEDMASAETPEDAKLIFVTRWKKPFEKAFKQQGLLPSEKEQNTPTMFLLDKVLEPVVSSLSPTLLESFATLRWMVGGAQFSWSEALSMLLQATAEVTPRHFGFTAKANPCLPNLTWIVNTAMLRPVGSDAYLFASPRREIKYSLSGQADPDLLYLPASFTVDLGDGRAAKFNCPAFEEYSELTWDVNGSAIPHDSWLSEPLVLNDRSSKAALMSLSGVLASSSAAAAGMHFADLIEDAVGTAARKAASLETKSFEEARAQTMQAAEAIAEQQVAAMKAYEEGKTDDLVTFGAGPAEDSEAEPAKTIAAAARDAVEDAEAAAPAAPARVEESAGHVGVYSDGLSDADRPLSEEHDEVDDEESAGRRLHGSPEHVAEKAARAQTRTFLSALYDWPKPILSVWLSTGKNASGIHDADAEVFQVLSALSGGDHSVTEPLAQDSIQGFADAGYVDNTGIAQAVAAGADEIEAFLYSPGPILTSDLAMLFSEQGGAEQGYSNAQHAMLPVSFPIFQERRSDIVQQLEQMQVSEESGGLAGIYIGKLSLMTANNKWFGIPAGRSISLSVTIVETNLPTLWKDTDTPVNPQMISDIMEGLALYRPPPASPATAAARQLFPVHRPWYAHYRTTTTLPQAWPECPWQMDAEDELQMQRLAKIQAKIQAEVALEVGKAASLAKHEETIHAELHQAIQQAQQEEKEAAAAAAAAAAEKAAADAAAAAAAQEQAAAAEAAAQAVTTPAAAVDAAPVVSLNDASPPQSLVSIKETSQLSSSLSTSRLAFMAPILAIFSLLGLRSCRGARPSASGGECDDTASGL